MKYLFIVMTAVLLIAFEPMNEAQAQVQKQSASKKAERTGQVTIPGSIVKRCEGRGSSCIENETLCRAGDQAACAARKAEEDEIRKRSKKRN